MQTEIACTWLRKPLHDLIFLMMEQLMSKTLEVSKTSTQAEELLLLFECRL